MPGKGTRRRTIRVSDDLWQRARREADSRGETIAEFVRKALEDYVDRRD